MRYSLICGLTIFVCNLFISSNVVFSAIGDGDVKNQTRYSIGNIQTRPINNKEIAIPPLKNNNPNNYQGLVESNLEREHRRQDGHVRDEFIHQREMQDYLSCVPHGRSSTVSKSDTNRISTVQMHDPNQTISEYFVMRRRVMVATMK